MVPSDPGQPIMLRLKIEYFKEFSELVISPYENKMSNTNLAQDFLETKEDGDHQSITDIVQVVYDIHKIQAKRDLLHSLLINNRKIFKKGPDKVMYGLINWKNYLNVKEVVIRR